MVFKENHFKYEIKMTVYQGNDHCWFELLLLPGLVALAPMRLLWLSGRAFGLSNQKVVGSTHVGSRAVNNGW